MVSLAYESTGPGSRSPERVITSILPPGRLGSHSDVITAGKDLLASFLFVCMDVSRIMQKLQPIFLELGDRVQHGPIGTHTAKQKHFFVQSPWGEFCTL